MSLCRQQSCAAGPSFEDMVAQLEEVKLSQRETKEMAQDISGSLDEAMKGLLEDVKKLKEENEKLKKENEELETHHRRARLAVIGADEVNKKLKEEIEEWKDTTEEYVEEEEANPDGLRSYLQAKTDEIWELREELEEIQERCISDGLEYLVEDK
jgi:ribosomal protein L22